ncbi:MAG: hypothetical protein HY566_01780 [Candidatus Kerfeldbacteria bacterium]|nr:hypothetical protein [Candidatus Kerfeldbacteria bacterium]
MRQSFLFPKTRKEAPRGETSANAQLLERGGFIAKLMAGVYAYLPLGLRVLKKIENIIRREMDALGAQELFLPALQSKELWDATGRWEGLSKVMYQFEDHAGRWTGLAVTHEEVAAELAHRNVKSYKDLPFALYQIQTKFRHELRAKSGLIRGREFSMKDLYSFHAREEDLAKFYDAVKESYLRIFSACGLTARIVEASGGDFSKEYSHEFQVFTDAGEDTVIYCSSCSFAQNAEIASGQKGAPCPQCHSNALSSSRAIEVGNIFKLGTRFSEPIGAHFVDGQGASSPIIMASYGIGPSRVLGTIVEVHHDEKGILWPATVSPFQLHLLALGKDHMAHATALYDTLTRAHVDVLFDDRESSAGEKFADADLLGIHLRAVVSARTESKIEVQVRGSTKRELLTYEELLGRLLAPQMS